jgi:hypothetical protein
VKVFQNVIALLTHPVLFLAILKLPSLSSSSNWLDYLNHRSCVSIAYSKTEHQTVSFLAMQCKQLCTKRHPHSVSSAYIEHAIRLSLSYMGQAARKLLYTAVLKMALRLLFSAANRKVTSSTERRLRAFKASGHRM